MSHRCVCRINSCRHIEPHLSTFPGLTFNDMSRLSPMLLESSLMVLELSPMLVGLSPELR